MKNYAIPITAINKFSNKDFSLYSFSARDYRKLLLENKNTIKLKDLLESKEKVGKEIGSEAYMDKSKYRFLKTVNISSSFLLEESSIEYCKPGNKVFPRKDEILIAKDGGGSGLGEVALYPYENKENVDSLSSGIIAIKIKEEKRNYVLGFLKSQHFKDFVDLNTAQGSTIRHSKLVALEYGIPFPTTANHPNPEKVETLVSLIVQNIIDKEEQIKLKNTQIDELIDKELKDNQKAEKFSYEYPRISEIKEETRLDSGLYEKEFKEIDFLIRNYEGGFNLLDIFVETFYSGSTPNFFEKQIGNYPYFVRPTEYNNKRIYTDLRKIHFDKNISKYRIDKKEGIILQRKGGTNTIYKPENLNVLIGDSVKFGIFKNINVSFLASFLSSIIIKFQLERIKSKTNGGSLTEKNLRNLLIPNFPEPKQQEIAKLYYNPLEKNKDLDLENYLGKEQTRNREVGIFQLNMEIFTLREKLEDLVHKIITNEKIIIDY